MKTLRLLLLLALFVNANHAAGQSVERYLARGDSLHKVNNHKAALEMFEKADALQPNSAAVQWRIAQEYYDFANSAEDARKEELYQKSINIARNAVDLDPTNARAHLQVAISAGMLAIHKGGKDKVELSKVVKEQAQRSIELDDSYHVAYHVLARWHYEIANLSWVLKTAAKVIYGGLPDASLDRSIELYQKAIELKPDNLNHRLELGKAYIAANKESQARKSLTNVVDLPASTEEDAEHKKRARELLEKL